MASVAQQSSPAEIEAELKLLIIEALKLEDMNPDDIDREASLLGDGLGLDSIDVLELAMAVHRKFSVRIEADDSQSQQIFANVKNLAAHIAEQRVQE